MSIPLRNIPFGVNYEAHQIKSEKQHQFYQKQLWAATVASHFSADGATINGRCPYIVRKLFAICAKFCHGCDQLQYSALRLVPAVNHSRADTRMISNDRLFICLFVCLQVCVTPRSLAPQKWNICLRNLQCKCFCASQVSGFLLEQMDSVPTCF